MCDPVLITVVEPGCPAEAAGIRPGDRLVALNGEILRDVIDYQLALEADELDFSLVREGRSFHAQLSGHDGRPLGLALEKSLFDKEKMCQNHCAFCFIDQLPPNCRSTLYIKDDDFRLSFLYGNFITLTNLSRADLDRIAEQRLSPLYVSIHSTDPRVRRSLVNPPKVDKALDNLKALLAAGTEVHVQIVACPGINNGAVLDETLATLLADFDAVASVGIVPVGLTGYRRGLPDLRSFSRSEAPALLSQVRAWQERALAQKSYRWVYAADEFYLMTGDEIPREPDYDDFPQVENGIGMVRLFMDEINDWAAQNGGSRRSGGRVNLVTAPLAAKALKTVLPVISGSTGRGVEVITANNNWLGGDVSVAGLLAGADVIEAIRTAGPVGPVLLPGVCLNPDGLFLDNLCVDDIIGSTGAEVIVVPSTGWKFMEALADV
ncbi:MAG: DUF512 domain-containing protein [Actinomycetota bacterium]|nr:DUF512 domain-containing protein [Actinomycetota bacterium]